MQNEERWKELCELAAKEQDPEKLLELTREINRLLLFKQNRLNNEVIQTQSSDQKAS
ncbi:MAG: hypothetical protein JO119_13905 [Acidobacteria bacterium]|nr:hypothetical protein [Acidobacteriota bacterium]